MIGTRARYVVDWGIIIPALIIISIGLVNLYSATHQGESSNIVFVQLGWIVVGGFFMAAAILIDYRIFDRFGYIIYGVVLFLLVAVLVAGTTAMGAQRWLALGPIRFQPSDLMKIALVIALAKYFSGQRRNAPYFLRELLIPILLVGIPAFLIILEPDLGTALLVTFVGMTICFFMKIRMQSIIIFMILAAIAIPFTWKFVLKEYQKDRVETFLNPASDPKGKGYHAIQSMIAVGSGRFLGKGYMKGTQTQLKFLPEQHTDFIFSVLAEEHGFFGSLIMLTSYLALLLFGLRAASKAKEKFGVILGLGVVLIIAWHVLINIGMVTGIMPVVGVPLPFLSYGGTSLVTSMIAIGLLINISMRRFIF
ncbi:MAG: rod shape-determining protein RodA [Deltaproteobacteria bacterium RIFCSPHIGHO2_12_FULL_43_9]|nr:MAG: rod shape-determining protein RodA [Deltaproteobacteria bacterium RIFCSPHIGHO2_12_FULL_43_9]